MRFDLETWGNEEIVLVHWDSIHGDDVVIVLRDGNAYLANRENDTQEKIDLVRHLVKFSKRQCSCEICMPV
jgi:hypothetical protein